MSTSGWVVTKRIWCERIGREARLMEWRVYPAEVLPDPSGYRVLAQRCESATDCNLRGFSCKWAFTRPELDPFELA
jgi:hypothetical protein